ncbi:LPS export ABC transporter permease LptF [Halocynthiibacter sp. C4]|uniref:LPS export ABC transporter permease LptF n=1 Tax=Halocynthiibacter sp. C4 TaxID=2992758 RepID=UPI00237A97AC|nr:LPS export ABC transporter permease LptF [Halocynthiibacter sp. C4]MDE0589356.1 LPS export ABC transporter permease LptF [Halocynthiibacter sp. C4]
MARFDRYVLTQLLVFFGFFSLVLVLVYWVNRAVSLFDQLIASGSSAGVFLEFTALTLPRVILLVLPFSAFVGTLYAINRLSSESELVVVQSSGYSPYRMARPVFVFGAIVALMMGVLANFLVPIAHGKLDDRRADMAQNVTAKILVDGTFLHPTKGVTLYIRNISPEGALSDVFLSDARSPGVRTSYSAKRALIVDDDEGPKLLMFDGIAQSLRAEAQRLFTTRFDDLVFDISDLTGSPRRSTRRIQELSTLELLNPTPKLEKETRSKATRMLYQGHQRIVQPLSAISTVLLAFSCLLLGNYSRFGLWPQIILAITLLIITKVVETATVDLAQQSTGHWPAAYLTVIVGLLLAFLNLWIAANPNVVKRVKRRMA